MYSVYKIFINMERVSKSEALFSQLAKIRMNSDKKYVLYAITDSKKRLKEFISSRREDLFYVIEDYFDDNIHEELKNMDEYLLYDNFKTKNENSNIVDVRLLVTRREAISVKQQTIYLQQLLFSGMSIVRMPLLKLLLDKYIESLEVIKYIDIYKYTFTGESDKPDLLCDEFAIFNHQSGFLFK